MSSLKRPAQFLPILIFGSLVTCALISLKCLRPSSADLDFESHTGMELPTGIKASAHKSKLTDNLFHTAHYWLLSGDEATMRELATKFGLERSDEDAKFIIPDMREMFGVDLNTDDFLEGYEGNFRGSRDHWLVIFSDKQTAVFVF